MRPLTEPEIRDAMINTSPDEAMRMPMPGLHEMLWDEREFLGWRDPQAPQRGYVVFWRDDAPVGFTVRAAESRIRGGSAMCSLCQTLQPADQVRMFSAPRAGAAGLRGNSVGTYICADLGCSTLIRIAPPATQYQPDQASAVAQRAAGLTQRLESFADKVLQDAA
jgi:hypothetical protein